MIKKIKTIVICLLLGTSVFGQGKKDKVLLKIDNKPVYQSEFIRLFGKNKNIEFIDEKQSIDNDLKLFVDYKLKLLEARALKLDTISAYKKEVSKYRNQLALPYLSDNSSIDSLVKEAYHRSLKEIKASHILIKLKENSSDTIAAYTKVLKLRNEIVNGANFSELAKKYSEDPSSKMNSGDLGFFSVFRMVSSFEQAAYNTDLGEVSPIFKSKFGYHILKVEGERKSKGEIEVAHIMLRDTSSQGRTAIYKIHQEILKGSNFEELVKKHSDDRRSASRGGRLNKFNLGGLPAPFGEISFSLSEDNKYSKPFKTSFGWHIVKFIKHYPIGTFEDSKNDLLKKVKKDDRSKNLSNPIVDRLKKEYKIKISQEAKEDFLDSKNYAKMDSLNKWLVVIENDTLKQKDFIGYIRNRRDRKAIDNFDPFVNDEILAYYKKNLEASNDEFRDLFQEYKNGLLLFDLMKVKIWDAAQNDTLGLQKFHNVNYKKYATKATVNALIVSSKNKKEIEGLKEYISKTAEIKILKNTLSKKEGVLIKAGDFEKSSAIFPKETSFTEGRTTIYAENGYTILVKIFKENEAVQQTFQDVRGKVISDYQNYIQDKWMSELRDKHKIKIYKSRLKKIKALMISYGE